MNIPNASQLRRALSLQDQKEKIDRELTAIFGTNGAPALPQQPKRKISARGIAAIRRAQKARWAKVRAAKKTK